MGDNFLSSIIPESVSSLGYFISFPSFSQFSNNINNTLYIFCIGKSFHCLIVQLI